MLKYKLSKIAEEDIKSIYAYILEDDKQAAKRVVIKIRQTFDLLVDLPHIGKVIGGLDVPGVRLVPVRKFINYLVIYLYTEDELLIIRVINAKQDLPTILSTEFASL